MTHRRLMLLWLALLGVGMLGMGIYDLWPCPLAKAPAHWPSATRLPLSGQIPTLLVFIHPHCPCSRSCMAELERLTARCEDQLSVQVVIGLPAEVPADWSDTDLVRTARSLAPVILDRNLLETSRFGVYTSGQALLYAPDGRLLFNGGITFARGHEGFNAGVEAIVASLHGHLRPPGSTPVYGCQLCDEFCGGSAPPRHKGGPGG